MLTDGISIILISQSLTLLALMIRTLPDGTQQLGRIQIKATQSPIVNSAVVEEWEARLGMRLPEMCHGGSCVEIRDTVSGVGIKFDTLSSLEGVRLKAGNEKVRSPVWHAFRSRKITHCASALCLTHRSMQPSTGKAGRICWTTLSRR